MPGSLGGVLNPDKRLLLGFEVLNTVLETGDRLPEFDPLVAGVIAGGGDFVEPSFEDVNGNGRIDFDDVVVLFNNTEDTAVTDNVEAFDFNDNGRIDFDDVVDLKQRVSDD